MQYFFILYSKLYFDNKIMTHASNHYVEYSIASFQHSTKKIKETLDMINNGFKIDFYHAEIIHPFV